MRTHHGGIEHLNEMRRLAHRRQRIEKGFEGPGSAQSPEPLPHAVPMPEFLRKRPPGDVMNHEILQGFEKLPVIAALVTAARVRGREHLQDNRPILIRHGREHGRSYKNRLPMSHRKSDLGIPLPYTELNPSTRPSMPCFTSLRFTSHANDPDDSSDPTQQAGASTDHPPGAL